MDCRKVIIVFCSVIFSIPDISIAELVYIPVAKVSGGEFHTLILTNSNNVYSCGYNGQYQLGDNTQTNRVVPVQVHGVNDVNYLQNIIAISAGWTHSLALDANHHVLAFGDNSVGQLGIGELPAYSATPVQVRDGEMNTDGNFLENIICIAAGRSGKHSLAVDASHFAWSWGINNLGQLGNGKSGDFNTSPVRVHGVNNDANGLRNIIAVSAGEEHSMALDVNGFVYTWGDNTYGKLGINDVVSDMCSVPVKVHGVNNVNYLQNIVAISAGWDHCMALEKIDANDPNCKGRVYTWGRNYDGRLGDGTTNYSRAFPVIVKAGQQDPNHSTSSLLQDIISISAGENYCMALDVNGCVWTWGNNDYGQLGIGNYNSSLTPVRVKAGLQNPDDPNSPLSNIVAISAGYWHGLAVDRFGRAWVWGRGEYGKLGIGSIDNKNMPEPLYVYDLNVYNETQNNKQYKRIQSAINEANNNDVIVVYEGCYGENVDCNKTVTLRSRAPNDWSVVDKTRIYGSTGVAVICLTNDNNSIINGLAIIGRDNGIYCDSGNAHPTISHCKILNASNTGISLSNSNANIINNIIYRNGTGIAVNLNPSFVVIRNNTIVNNSYDGIYSVSYGVLNLNGNIVWGNNLSGYFDSVNYCCIQGGGDWSSGQSQGNISSDPCFRDADADDYHLQSSSPCIDRGDPCFSSSSEVDIDGEERVMDGNSDGNLRIDIGADEFCPWDLNQDHFVDFYDFVIFARTWRLSSGEPNYNYLCDFSHDNKIDINDLRIFSAHWLTPSDFEGLGGQGAYFAENSGGGGGEMMMSMQEQESAAFEVEQAVDIDKLVNWLDELWLSDELKGVMTQEEYQEFRKAVEGLEEY
ncbi:MAG: right-handed parallel beta-helix repeat-containing protein [Sedimentisphaerales bacterium]